MSKTVEGFWEIDECFDGWYNLAFNPFNDSPESKDLCGCGPTCLKPLWLPLNSGPMNGQMAKSIILSITLTIKEVGANSR